MGTQRMSTGKKIALGILIFLAVVVVAAVIIIPRLIDVDRYRPEVVERIRTETGKSAEIGRLTLTLFPTVSIRVDDFALANPAGFPAGYFVKAKRINAEVDAHALWNRQIVITSLKLEEPEINLLQSPGGRWNFETLQRSKIIKRASLTAASSFSLGVISKVTVVKGQLSAAKLSSSGNPAAAFFEAHGFSSQLEEVDVNAFGASLSKSLAPRPGNEIAGVLWFGPVVAFADSSQNQPAAHGTLKAETLHFQTVQITSLSSQVRLYPKEVFFDDLGFDLYGGHAKGGVQFNFAGINPNYKLNAQMTGVDVARLIADFPGARGAMTGKLQGNIDLDGEVTRSPDPLAGMRGIGSITVRNGNLPKLQLNKNLMALAKLSNLGAASGDPGSFSSIVADLNIANSRIASRRIAVVGNGVSAEGTGNMTLLGAGTLNYQGVASIAAGANQLTNILAGMSGGTLSGGKLTLPFGIGGTFNAPKFIQKAAGAGQLGNLGNLLGGKVAPGTTGQNQQQNPANLVQGIADMFKKKKN